MRDSTDLACRFPDLARDLHAPCLHSAGSSSGNNSAEQLHFDVESRATASLDCIVSAAFVEDFYFEEGLCFNRHKSRCSRKLQTAKSALASNVGARDCGSHRCHNWLALTLLRF